MNKKILAIDPGTNYTGYGLFEESPVETWRLKQYGLVKRLNSDDFDVRCLSINSKIRGLIVENNVSELVLELPTFQAGSTGMAAARAGDILKLSYLCGKIACGWELWITEYSRRHEVELDLTRLIHPQQWKGQTSKAITGKRCNDKYGIKEVRKSIDHNFIDAIMIGDWYIEKLRGVVEVDVDAEFLDI